MPLERDLLRRSWMIFMDWCDFFSHFNRARPDPSIRSSGNRRLEETVPNDWIHGYEASHLRIIVSYALDPPPSPWRRAPLTKFPDEFGMNRRKYKCEDGCQEHQGGWTGQCEKRTIISGSSQRISIPPPYCLYHIVLLSVPVAISQSSSKLNRWTSLA